MYQYIFDDETTKKINDSTTKAKSVFEQFNDIDNRYSNLANTDNKLELEKVEYTKPTQSQVQKRAQESLESYKNSSINSINENFDKKNQNINEDIESAKKNNLNEINSIKQNYENVKQNAKDDAIKRGLARSSIIVNTLSNLDQNMIDSLTNKANELNSALTSFENEKNLLEVQKQNALTNFDIEYAVKLQDKITEINSEIEQKQQEVLEYNNKIAEKEAQWEKDNSEKAYDKTVEMAKLMAEHGITVFEILKQNEKYGIAKNHFQTLSKEDAINELKNNSDYLKHLGSSFYNKLLTELEKRSN